MRVGVKKFANVYGYFYCGGQKENLLLGLGNER